ncbi:MAG TPA: transcription termination factor NusA [Dehalococcoidia bacterium]|nr:transcription termination factor NusA [Dehalococcoidia bacterium]
MKNDFLVAISQLSAEKNLPREVVFEAVETALASAYKKEEVHANNVTAKIDPATGDVRVWAAKEVVEIEEDVADDRDQIPLAEARKFDPNVKIGDTLVYEVTPANAGRIAAQTAKQVVMQRLREAEREVVFEEFAQREGDIVSGVITRVESRQVLVDLGKTEAVMPPPEQVRSEHYRPGQRMKFYVLQVFRANKGPQVIVSRTHKDLVKRVFELEVPEIFKGVVEIKAIAREPGSRTKVAVYSRQEGIDAVGACVGLRGVRIQNVVNELQGERIDVIQWDPEPRRFVANALSPAQVLAVRIYEPTNTAYVAVPDRQLSLAIGKEGQNARLAAKLTGRRIDIKSQTAAEEEYGGLEPPLPEEPAVAVASISEPAIEAGVTAEPHADVEVAEVEDEFALPPEEEAALAFEEPVPVEVPPTEQEPVVAAERGKPALRFAEDILGAPERAGDRRRRREFDEPEVPAKPVKKKKAAKARRLLPDEEEEVLDELDDVEDMEYPGLRR